MDVWMDGGLEVWMSVFRIYIVIHRFRPPARAAAWLSSTMLWALLSNNSLQPVGAEDMKK
jgi:hypothetical protein